MEETREGEKEKEKESQVESAASPMEISIPNRETAITSMSRRGAIGITEENCDRITKNYIPLPKKERKALKEEVMGLMMIKDPKTGKNRIADFKNQEDMKILSKKTRLMKKTKKNINNGLPSDPKSGMVKLSKADLPQDFTTHKLLPILDITVAKYFAKYDQDIDEIMLWLPLLNLPVNVPNLFLLMNGHESTCVVNSFAIIKWYMMSLKLFSNVDYIRSRKTEALKWLRSQVDQSTLTKGNLVLLVDHMSSTYTDDSKEEEKKKKGFQKYILYPSDLINRFEEGKLCVDDVDAVYDGVKDISRYPGCPWSGEGEEGLVFIEDLLQDHNKEVHSIQANFLKHLSQLNPNTSSSTKDKEGKEREKEEEEEEEEYFYQMINNMYTCTFDLIICYEYYIIRALDEANLEGPIFTEKYRGSFRFKREIPYSNYISKRLAEIIVDHRIKITTIRGEALRSSGGKEKYTTLKDYGDQEDLIKVCLNPALDLQTMRHFQAFLDYNIKHKEELIAGADAMTKILNDFRNQRIEGAGG